MSRAESPTNKIWTLLGGGGLSYEIILFGTNHLRIVGIKEVAIEKWTFILSS